MSTIKTAIAMPQADFLLVEKMRKKLHKTRSQLLVEAFREWVEKRRGQKLDEQYAEAYRKQPEDDTEMGAFQNASLSAWPKEDW